MRNPRAVAFAVVLVLCVVGAGAFVARATIRSHEDATDTTVSRTSIARVTRAPFIVFLTAHRDDAGYDRVAIAPLAHPDRRIEVGLHCDRVAMTGGTGICIRHRTSLGVSYRATFFDASFGEGASAVKSGIPSRARVSPDGRYAAATSFVTGHSYATAGHFSTATTIFQARTGRALGDLESFRTFRDGRRFEPLDRNFWGVTFSRDGRTFFATMGTGKTTYLVRGDLRTRTLRTVHENVECPSLSPDELRIASKKRMPNGSWRFTVLDLRTGRETPLSERRSIDDQIAWLDDAHVLYAAGSTVWMMRADGGGAPRRLLERAISPVVVSPTAA